jgi:hypothetical protein
MTRTFVTLGMAVALLATVACTRADGDVLETDVVVPEEVTVVDDAIVASELAGGEDTEVVADEDATVAPETAAPEVAAPDAGGVVAPN